MNIYSKYLILFISLMVGSSGIFAREVISSDSNGTINWSTGMISAEGYGVIPESKLNSPQGKLLARRGAMVDAYRNLAEIVHGVQVTSGSVVKDMMAESSTVATRVKGLIKGAQVVTQEFKDGVYRVTLAMPLKNRFIGAVYPDKSLKSSQSRIGENLFFDLAKQILPFIRNAYAKSELLSSLEINNQQQLDFARKLIAGSSNNRDLIGRVKDAIDLYEESASFSGLIVDASAVSEFELATIPRLRDKRGVIIYPNSDTSYDDVIKKRPVSYDFDVNDAIVNNRVASTPFVAKAIGIYKELKSDLIISDEHVELIKRMNLSGPVKQARVIVVVPE